MRVLIVGAGVAGMTLAALLERRGIRSTLVERAPDFEHAGYMLGLYSLGSRVLHGLGLYERFAAEAVPMTHYAVFDGHGELIKKYEMGTITDRFGPILNTTRPDLIQLLQSGLGDVEIRFGTSVDRIDQPPEGADESGVRVALSDGTEEEFDLVVGADGLHSTVRKLVFGEQPYFHTEWGGWVWWREGDIEDPGTTSEFWGAGRFMGAYPTPRGIGVFGGAPLGDDYGKPGEGRRDRISKHFTGWNEQVDGLLDALPPDDADLFFWKLSDVRSAEWVRGGVVLMGDSAAGFLPTAGIGASMAMESAAVLADELSRTDVAFLGRALDLYTKRRKARVEAIQDDSRKLARMMFVQSGPIAALRDFATRFYSLEMLAADLTKAFDQPI